MGYSNSKNEKEMQLKNQRECMTKEKKKKSKTRKKERKSNRGSYFHFFMTDSTKKLAKNSYIHTVISFFVSIDGEEESGIFPDRTETHTWIDENYSMHKLHGVCWYAFGNFFLLRRPSRGDVCFGIGYGTLASCC